MESNTMLNVKVVPLSGRLDSYTIAESRKRLEDAIKVSPPNIVVDMHEVTFVDSTALSALILALKRSREQNGDVRLCCLQQPVRMVFELTRLDKVFEIFSTQQEAVRAFNE